jgi:hypothetical protein
MMGFVRCRVQLSVTAIRLHLCYYASSLLITNHTHQHSLLHTVCLNGFTYKMHTYTLIIYAEEHIIRILEI